MKTAKKVWKVTKVALMVIGVVAVYSWFTDAVAKKPTPQNAYYAVAGKEPAPQKFYYVNTGAEADPDAF